MNCNSIGERKGNLLALHGFKIITRPFCWSNFKYYTIAKLDNRICLRSFTKVCYYTATPIHKALLLITIGKKHHLCTNRKSEFRYIRCIAVKLVNGKFHFRPLKINHMIATRHCLHFVGVSVTLELFKVTCIYLIDGCLATKEKSRSDFKRLPIKMLTSFENCKGLVR